MEYWLILKKNKWRNVFEYISSLFPEQELKGSLRDSKRGYMSTPGS